MAETKINADQTGFVAGQNITLTIVPPEGGIDTNTLYCFPFDGNLNNLASSSTVSAYNTPSYSSTSGTYKFEQSFVANGNRINFSGFGITLNDFTIDFWAYFPNNYDVIFIGDRANYNTGGKNMIMVGSNGKITYKYTGDQKQITLGDGSAITGLHHFAIQTEDNGADKYLRVFVDGEQKAYDSLPSWDNLQILTIGGSSTGNICIDELRISNIARYTSAGFTVPSTAYTIAVPTGKTAINFDTTSITGYNAGATQTLKNINGILTWVND